MDVPCGDGRRINALLPAEEESKMEDPFGQALAIGIAPADG
jgi:hypothetical protein